MFINKTRILNEKAMFEGNCGTNVVRLFKETIIRFLCVYKMFSFQLPRRFENSVIALFSARIYSAKVLRHTAIFI